MLVDALEKLAAARGADEADGRRQRHRAIDFFKHRGYAPQSRNTVLRGDEWLANTTMEKQLAGSRREQCLAITCRIATSLRSHRYRGACDPSRPGRYIGRRGAANYYAAGDDDGARTPLSLRHDAARRRADQRRRLLARGQGRDRRSMLDELGIDYVEGGYPGANPTDTEFFAKDRAARRHVHRLRHDQAAGPLGLERSGPRGAARRQGRRHLLRRQDLGLSCPRRARDHARGEPRRRSATVVAAARRHGPRGAARLRAFLRRLQGQSATTRWPAPRPPTRPARAGSCCATPMAARCRTRSRRSSARW